MAIVEFLFWQSSRSIFVAAILLFIFFTAFNLLEACLPSLVAREAPSNSRGSAMGIFSTFQYLGIFIGGTVGGLILQHLGLTAVFAFCVGLTMFWLVFLLMPSS